MKMMIISVLFIAASLTHAQWQPNGILVCDTSANSGFYMLPQIAPDGNGGAFVCWRDARTGDFDIYMQHIFTDGNMQFVHNGIPLCNAPYSQQFPRMVSDGRGGAFVAWEDDRTMTQTYVYVQRIDTNGQPLWTSNGVRAAEMGGLFISISLEPRIGGVLLGWSTVEDVFVQCLDSLGNRVWGDSGVQVTNRLGTIQAGGVAITGDGDGGAIVAWTEGNIVYAQRVDSAGNVLWQTNGITLSDSTKTSGAVAVSSDLRGGAIVSWSSTVGYVQRISPSGQILWGNSGISFGEFGPGGSRRNVSDGLGGVFVGHGRLIQHVDSSGLARWQGSGVFFTMAQTSLANSSQIKDRVQGIWNFWAQGGASFDIYGQYIDIAGNRQWESNGRPVCTATNMQDFPRAASDGNGRAIVIWDDFRNGHSNVYASKVDTSGVITEVSKYNDLLPPLPHLEQNYPNPFNPMTTIRFKIAKASRVSLKVYNLLGQEVATLVDERKHAGQYYTVLDAFHLGSGVYFYHLTTEQTTIVKKMILMR